MNLLKHSSKYNKYLDRINDYKSIADKNEAFSSIEARVEQLHQDLRNNNHKVYYKRVYQALLGLSLILAISCFISGAVISGVILSVSIVTSKFLYNKVIKNLIESTQNEQGDQLDESSFDVKLKQKMDYLQNGIDLKMARIQMVRNSFMGMFGLCMVAGLKLSGVPIEMSLFVVSIIAIMISGGFWFYFFKDDLDILEYQDMELAEYIDVFQSKCNWINNEDYGDREEPTPNEDDTTNRKEKQYFQDEQEEDDEVIEVVPPMPHHKSIDDIYKQLTLDV